MIEKRCCKMDKKIKVDTRIVNTLIAFDVLLDMLKEDFLRK